MNQSLSGSHMVDKAWDSADPDPDEPVERGRQPDAYQFYCSFCADIFGLNVQLPSFRDRLERGKLAEDFR